MSEKSERLLSCMNDLRDDTLVDALEYVPANTKKKNWKRWGTLAAALVLVIGVAGVTGILPLLPIGMGGSSGGSGAAAEPGGASTFMSYAGPVFPLTLREENDAVTAQRDITLDFAPWVKTWISNEEEAASRDWLSESERQDVLNNYNEWYPEGGRWRSSNDILVSDAYTLSNTTGEEQTVSVLYPFASSLGQLGTLRPELTVDGEAVETTLHVGDYVGGFEGAYGGDLLTPEEEGSVNLDMPDSWEDYRDAMELDAYLEKALGDWPDLSEIHVTVYRFTDPWGEEENSKAGRPNPSLRVTFNMDYDKTHILTYGFHSGKYDSEKGIRGCGFSIPQEGERGYGEPYYIIVEGEDVKNMTYTGHVTGGWDNDPKIEAGVTVTRYETDLDSALREVMVYNVPNLLEGKDTQEQRGYDFELWYGAFCDYLITYGPLADSGAERYSEGMLEFLDSESVQRVLYLEAEVVIPANSGVVLTAELTKEPSFDYYCANKAQRGVNGYDLVTKLGSNLACTTQNATLLDHGQIEIINQNFGFDLAAGVKTVELSPDAEHYYLEVKRIAEQN